MLVIGAGTAGCVAAAVFAGAGRRVTVLEGGPREVPLGAAAMPIGDGSPHARHPRARWEDGEPAFPVRGRGIGGSGAVNGGYFVAPPRGFAAGIPGWEGFDAAVDHVLRAFAPVRAPGDPVTAVFERRFPGARRLEVNVREGRRTTAAAAFRDELRDVEFLAGVEVDGLVIDGDVCRGVRAVDGRGFTARETVLCAGAVGSAGLLLRAGVGEWLPVGIGAVEHPEMLVPVRVRPPYVPAAVPLAAVAVVGAPSGRSVEIRPYTAPLPVLIAGGTGVRPDGAGAPPEWGVARLDPPGGARVVLGAGGDPEIVYATPDEADAADAAAVLAGLAVGPPRRSVSQHLVGTAAVGRVVDAAGAIPGIRGLRVADGSVLPALPPGGPHVAVAAAAWTVAALVAKTARRG